MAANHAQDAIATTIAMVARLGEEEQERLEDAYLRADGAARLRARATARRLLDEAGTEREFLAACGPIEEMLRSGAIGIGCHLAARDTLLALVAGEPLAVEHHDLLVAPFARAATGRRPARRGSAR